ncbi:dynein beta chain, ciliary [Trichonephila clavipes]|nr:dynein beta chain, ciliary [Trichonephila clavipes]
MILRSDRKATRRLLTADLDLNFQLWSSERTTLELAPPSPSYHTIPMNGCGHVRHVSTPYYYPSTFGLRPLVRPKQINSKRSHQLPVLGIDVSDRRQLYHQSKITIIDSLATASCCQKISSVCSPLLHFSSQRNFCVLSVPPTTADSMQTIFGLQLKEHLRRIHPPSESQEEVEEFRISVQQQIVRLAMYLHKRMSSAFHPTALKFHYVFNLRDISNVFRRSKERFTNTDLVDMHLIYGLAKGNARASEGLYRENYLQRKASDPWMLTNLHQNWFEYGSFRGNRYH